MAASKTTQKTKNQSRRGGVRPGAGRPRGTITVRESEKRDYRTVAIEHGLAALDHAMKSYPIAGDDWTDTQHRRHIAFVLLGLPTKTITAALFKPTTSERFSRALSAAIAEVNADVAALD